MLLETLLISVQTRSVRGPRNVDIRALAYDSRRVRTGSLFVALPGQRENGVRYVEDAISRGAVAVMKEGAIPSRRGVTWIEVEDARRALAEMACAFSGNPSARLSVAGVTGTNGKTTVTYMLRDILGAAGKKPGMIGTVVYEIGDRVIPASRTTPEAPDLQDMLAQMAGAGCRSAVMEVSSHALVQQRVGGVAFDVAVFTNLTHDHLDYHGSMESYFEAKSLLFKTLGQGGKPGRAVINRDDPWGRRLAEQLGRGVHTITFGADGPADVRAEKVRMGSEGSHFFLRTPVGSTEVALPLLGPFNVSNALAATAAALAMDIPLDICAGALGRFHAAPGRLEPVPFRSGIRVYVDYAHTDDALSHVLKAVRTTTTGRLLLVFGCGGNRDRAKRPRMGAVAAVGADWTVLTTDNPRNEDPIRIVEEIAAGFGGAAHRYEVELDRERAIQIALEKAQPGDVVLLAGKGHEHYQEFHRTVVPFDDRQVVLRAGAARGKPGP